MSSLLLSPTRIKPSNVEQAQYVTEMVAAYLETAIWADAPRDDDEIALPHKGFSKGAVDKATVECAHFVDRMLLTRDTLSPAQAGHYLWLSRNGHGTGFFDCDHPHADLLHECAQRLGEAYLFITDSGYLGYIS